MTVQHVDAYTSESPTKKYQISHVDGWAGRKQLSLIFPCGQTSTLDRFKCLYLRNSLKYLNGSVILTNALYNTKAVKFIRWNTSLGIPPPLPPLPHTHTLPNFASVNFSPVIFLWMISYLCICSLIQATTCSLTHWYNPHTPTPAPLSDSCWIGSLMWITPLH